MNIASTRLNPWWGIARR